jgi:hypothetical protein
MFDMNITENIKRIVSVDFNCGYKTKLFDKDSVKGFLYLTKKSFKKLKKDSDEPPYVVGDVYIKRKRYEDINKADDPQYLAWKKESKNIIGIVEVERTDEYILEHPDEEIKRYDLFKHRAFRRCIGYAETDNGQYVRMIAYFPILPLLLLLLFLLLLLLSHCPKTPSTSIPEPTTIETTTQIIEQTTIPTDPNIVPWDGELPTSPSSETEQEEIELIGYDFLTVSGSSRFVNLINPKGNTVYYKYSIKANGVEVFNTGLIPANMYIPWNAYSTLTKMGLSGEVNVELNISTFDINSYAPCNHATIKTTITIN